MIYTISYSGWKVTDIEAKNPKEAEKLFWGEGHNDLYDAEIQEVTPALNLYSRSDKR